MNRSSSRPARYVGLLLIGLGVVLNKWVVEFVFSPDGSIGSSRTVLAIIIVQLALIGLGVYVLIRRPAFNFPSKQESLLLSLSLIGSFLVAEIAMRIWLSHFSSHDQYRKYVLYTDIPPEKMQYSPHHYLNYYPTPNYRDGLTTHNTLGFRGPEVSPQRPQGTYRIVAIGGSTTYTTGVSDNDETFPSQLERALRDEYGYPHVEVVNAGVAGYDSWESLMNLQFRVLDLEPDLLLIYHGTNDVHARLVLPDTYRGDNSGRRKQWEPPRIPVFERSVLLRVISRKLGWTGQVGLGSFVSSSTFLGAVEGGNWGRGEVRGTELLTANAPKFLRRNFVSMVGIAKVHAVQVVLATWAYSPHFDDYAATATYRLGYQQTNEIVKEVAELYETPLLDFAALMSQDKRYWADGRHVNERGALMKAMLYANFIDSAGFID